MDTISISSPQIADACLQLKIPFKIAPTGIKPVSENDKVYGPVLPVRHYGSVDVFLEVMNRAKQGDVLVIDNNGRLDEGCIGDLTVLEAKANNIQGIIVWGANRDTPEIKSIGLPVFTYGVFPSGPRRLDEREPEVFSSAKFDDFTVSSKDMVFADIDGVIFFEKIHYEKVTEVANQILATERRQADEVIKGNTLYKQLKFEEFLEIKETSDNYSFRDHLNKIGGAIEK